MLTKPVAYSPQWPALFETLQSRLAAATALDAGQIEHIGSTAVPGLCAKPIIDIQIGVSNLNTFDPACLLAASATPVVHFTQDDPFRDADPNNWAKKFARIAQGDHRLAHVHIREIGKPNHRFALLFRDYLRADTETRDLYAWFKTAAAHHCAEASGPGGTGAYLDLKDPFVQLVACRAEDWASATGWQIAR